MNGSLQEQFDLFHSLDSTFFSNRKQSQQNILKYLSIFIFQTVLYSDACLNYFSRLLYPTAFYQTSRETSPPKSPGVFKYKAENSALYLR